MRVGLKTERAESLPSEHQQVRGLRGLVPRQATLVLLMMMARLISLHSPGSVVWWLRQTAEVLPENAPNRVRFAKGVGVPGCSMNDSTTVLTSQT
jgi:hypothetical protein